MTSLRTPFAALPEPTSTLFELIRQRNWTAVTERLLAYPPDVEYRPPRGENQITVLHLSCVYRAPMDVILLLLDANPKALLTQDSVGCTPLHTAIAQGGSEEVVLMLIRRGGIMGSSISSPLMGSPLCLACRHGVSINILKELLRYNALMATVSNEHGLKPCQLIWYHFERDPANFHIIKLLNEDDGDASSCNVSRKRARDEIPKSNATHGLLERLRLILDGIQRRNGEDSPSRWPHMRSLIWKMVEGQPNLGNLSNFLSIAVLVRPQELSIRDAMTGDFVLHLAASIPRIPENAPPLMNRRHSSNACRRSRDSIDILVHEYPGAASVRNHEGHFPLHLALCEGRRTWRTGIASLTKASMEPLERRERRTGLYPFQLAAMSAVYPMGQSPEESLETILQLLLACPHVLSCNTIHVHRG
jgi:hypothetical protein